MFKRKTAVELFSVFFVVVVVGFKGQKKIFSDIVKQVLTKFLLFVTKRTCGRKTLVFKHVVKFAWAASVVR